MSDILRRRIEWLRLNPDRSFPSQAEDAKQMIKEWRYAQRRFRLVDSVTRGNHDSDIGDHGDSDDNGG